MHELGSRYLGDAVDAADSGGGRVPALPSGSVSRAANPGSSAIARRDILRTMPLAVADLTNSRREILIVPRLSLPERFVPRVRVSAHKSAITDDVASKNGCQPPFGSRIGHRMHPVDVPSQI
jgi:hypothetical protein